MLVGGAGLLFVAQYVDMIFLGYPFDTMITYLWSRRFPDENLNLNGLFVVFRVILDFYFPLLTFMFSGTEAVMHDLIGIAIAHLIFYFADIFPKITGL